MPILKTFTGDNQFSEPILVGHEEKLQWEIKEATPSFSATVAIQWLIGSDDPSRPSDADLRWTTVQEINAGSTNIAGAFDGGKAWYRLAILNGEYTSGTADTKLQTG